jgi:hypothetical protein
MPWRAKPARLGPLYLDTADGGGFSLGLALGFIEVETEAVRGERSKTFQLFLCEGELLWVQEPMLYIPVRWLLKFAA